MTRQYIYGQPSDQHKKKLFVDNGINWLVVGAQIIEPYGSPVPQTNSRELKMINAPSHIQTLGISSYRVTLVLLFNSKNTYSNYMAYVGFGHKFYDERGVIYTGAVESIKATPVEGTARYKAEVGLVLVKKDQSNNHARIELFQDTGDRHVNDLTRLGVIPTMDQYGDPQLYFYPWSTMPRGLFAQYLVRTKRLIEQTIRE
ncbi:S-layer homology domain-containing protein [Peribacillus frigoritolerans]|uniref:S-layer homology domain-containing protein n=1 Tax=Peribacillus castrilensis TaxID=2897690 RepID=A0AAW9NMJ3_9BACI|nr:S-layer homology domain-containing protein [Peribacillus castrilensis]